MVIYSPFYLLVQEKVLLQTNGMTMTSLYLRYTGWPKYSNPLPS